MLYSGDHVEGYLPSREPGRVEHVGRRLVVRYSWGVLFPRADNVTAVRGSKAVSSEAAA